jgi:hypothetical protein
MFTGLEYKYECETSRKSLVLESDGSQIRQTLTSVEWLPAEAIRNVFLLSAILQTAVVMSLIGWLLSSNSMGFQAKAIFVVLCIAMVLAIYWLSKFVLWYEISRHLKPRKFGDLFAT